MIYSKYEVMKRCISGKNFPSYYIGEINKDDFEQCIFNL